MPGDDLRHSNISSQKKDAAPDQGHVWQDICSAGGNRTAIRAHANRREDVTFPSVYLQELRGWLQTQASAWTTGPIRLRQGGMGHAFSEKFGTTCQIFRKKTKKHHAAAGEIRRYRVQTVRLNAHRVSPVTYSHDVRGA